MAFFVTSDEVRENFQRDQDPGTFRAVCRRGFRVDADDPQPTAHCSVLFTDAGELAEHLKAVHADWIREERRERERHRRSNPDQSPPLPLLGPLPRKRPRVRPAVPESKMQVSPGDACRTREGLLCQVIGYTAPGRVAVLVTVPRGEGFYAKGQQLVEETDDYRRYRVVQPEEPVTRAVTAYTNRLAA